MKKSTDAAFASLRYKCRNLQRKCTIAVKQAQQAYDRVYERLQSEVQVTVALLNRVTELENELHECQLKPCANVCGDSSADVQDHAELRYLEAQVARTRQELDTTKELLKFKADWLDSITAENRRLDDELAHWKLFGTLSCTVAVAALGKVLVDAYPYLLTLVQ